jgi:hypothetical protein
MVKKLANHLTIDASAFQVRVCIRLGRKQLQPEGAASPRPRPLKVVFSEEQAKFAFLSKIGLLASKPMGAWRVGIKADLSPIQRELENGLRDELAKKRNDPKNKDKRFKIVRKRVVEAVSKEHVAGVGGENCQPATGGQSPGDGRVE